MQTNKLFKIGERVHTIYYYKVIKLSIENSFGL